MRDFSNNTSLLSINGATVRQRWDIGKIIEGCASRQIGGIAPWRDQVAQYGLDKTARHIRQAGLKVSGLCRGGMFPAPGAAGRKANIEDNIRAIDEAAALDAACLVLVVGGLPEGSRDLQDAHNQVEDGIAAILEHARSNNIRLAIEPLHPMYAADRACVNTLKHGLDICDRLGAGIGVAVDVYHLWWDPELEAQISRAGKKRQIFAFHVCDWLVPTSDMLLDRGMMGDGIIDIPKIRDWVESAGFAGQCEVEIFSAENWWKKDPNDVLDICVERCQSVV